MAPKAGQVITVVLTLALFMLIYMPIIVVNGYKYGVNRHHIVFKKRYAKLTIIVVILIVIKLLYESMVLSVVYLIPIPNNTNIYRLIFDCIDSFFAFGILYCWVWRFWLLSYECKLLVYMNKNKWQIIINENYCKTKKDLENHWYLTHKKTFGNYYFIGKYIIIPFIAISSLIKVAFLVCKHYFHESNLIQYILTVFIDINYLIPFIMLLVIFQSIPKVWDNFYICSELRKICMILSIDYISYILRSMLELAITNTNTYWLIDVTQKNLTIFAQFICVMIATHWVNNKVSSIIQNNKFDLFNIEESRMPLIAVRSKTVTTFSSNPINQPLLTDILSNYKSFEIFIKHLMAEFSIECLLSLVEIIQFQQFIYTNYFRNFQYKFNEDYFHESLFKKINFPESVPKSKIIYGEQYDNKHGINNTNNGAFLQTPPHKSKKKTSKKKLHSKSKSQTNVNVGGIMALREDEEISNDISNNTIESKLDDITEIKETLKKISKEIYLKYIAVGSQYEINIAWCLRGKIIKLFDNNNLNENGKDKALNDYEFSDFIDLYDEVCNEMYKLMRDSYDRFRRKNEYQKLKKSIFVT